MDLNPNYKSRGSVYNMICVCLGISCISDMETTDRHHLCSSPASSERNSNLFRRCQCSPGRKASVERLQRSQPNRTYWLLGGQKQKWWRRKWSGYWTSKHKIYVVCLFCFSTDSASKRILKLWKRSYLQTAYVLTLKELNFQIWIRKLIMMLWWRNQHDTARFYLIAMR